MYPALEELIAASNVPELTTLEPAQQEAKRVVAIRQIERYTGQKFEPQAFTAEAPLVVQGSGGRELWLPKRIEELTSVRVKGTSMDVTDVAIDEDGKRLYITAWSTDYATAAMREQAIDTRTFRSGAGMVELGGVFGWTDAPEEVEQAIRIDMEEQAQAEASALSGTVNAYRRLGLSDVSQGNLRATIGKPDLVSPRVEALLYELIWTGAAGYLSP